MRDIRVAFVGNIANNFFREAYLYKEHPQLEPNLYLKDLEVIPNTEHPSSDIPDLLENETDWIRDLPERPDRKWFKWFNSLNYDLVVLSGPESLLAPKLRAKKLFRATGTDLTAYPILSHSDWQQFRPKNSALRKKVSENFRQSWTPSFRGYLSRAANSLSDRLRLRRLLDRQRWKRAINSCDWVSASAEGPFLRAISRLGLEGKHLDSHLRLVIDLDVFRPVAVSDRPGIFKGFGFRQGDFIVLMPARVNMRSIHATLSTGGYKGCDVVLDGFEQFLNSIKMKRGNRREPFLVVPDRELSDELEDFKELVRLRGLGKNVRFVKGVAEDGLTRHELIKLWSITSVTVDDVGSAWFGSAAIEALAMESPVITRSDEAFMSSHYGENPFLQASSPEEVCSQLIFVYNSHSKSASLGKDGRSWVERFHAGRNVLEHNFEILETSTR